MPLSRPPAAPQIPPGSIELPPLDPHQPWRVAVGWNALDALDIRYYAGMLRERLGLDEEAYCNHLLRTYPQTDTLDKFDLSKLGRSQPTRSLLLENAFCMQVRAEMLERATRKVASPSVNPERVYAEDLAKLNDLGEPHIRLLRSTRRSTGLQYDLELFRLRDAPPYAALSYSWGDSPPDTHMVFKHTHDRLSISSHLGEALAMLEGANDQQWLWVDAICINQAHPAEKSDQVRRMKTIFERAKCVIVWLGAEIGHLIGNDDCLTFCPGNPNPWSSSALDVGEHRPEESQLRQLLDRRHTVWWSRLWIVQEIAASAAVMVCLGSRLIAWDKFAKTITTAFRTSLVDRSLLLRFRAAQRQIKALQTMRKTLRSNPGGEDLLELIRTTTDSFASHASDKVYALLGLATLRDQRAIEVNYEHAPARVFAGVALHIIESKRTLDILVDQWRRRCGLLPDPATSALPSWVPDFSLPIRRYPLPLSQVHNYHASNKRPPSVRQRANSYQLHLQAVKFDIIEEAMYECLEEDEMDDELDAFRLIALPVMAQLAVPAMERGLPPEHRLSGLDRADSFWRTLIVDHEHDKSLPAGSNLGEAFKSLFDHNTDDLEIFTATLGATGVKQVRDYISLVRQTMRRRALFSTYSGFVGVGPDKLQRGDLIVVPLGSSTPLVLRPTDAGGKYALVVDCYVHGIMYGELMRLLDAGQVELEWMTLK